MSKPSDGFWELAGIALVFLSLFGGLALIAWASHA